jgi:hypothetical protein
MFWAAAQLTIAGAKQIAPKKRETLHPTIPSRAIGCHCLPPTPQQVAGFCGLWAMEAVADPAQNISGGL